MSHRRAIVTGVEALGLREAPVSLLLLPREQGRSVVVVWTGPESAPAAFAKLSHGPEGEARLNAEVTALSGLRGELPEELRAFLPATVSVRGGGTGRIVTVQTAVGERNLVGAIGSRGAKPILSAHDGVAAPLNWLFRFQSWQMGRDASSAASTPGARPRVRPGGATGSDVGDIGEHLRATLDRLAAGYARAERRVPDVLRAGTETLQIPDSIRTVALRAIQQHGDFSTHNLVMGAGRFSGVVDWEAYGLVSYPLHDLWTFSLSILEEIGGRPASLEEVRALASCRPAEAGSPILEAWAQARDRFVSSVSLDALDPDLLLRIQILHWIEINLLRVTRIDSPETREMYRPWLDRFEGWLAALEGER